jgi:IS5 family transposase
VIHDSILLSSVAGARAHPRRARNKALLAKAAQAKLLRTSRLRTNTRLVPADVTYPTDSELLAKAVRRLATTVR